MRRWRESLTLILSNPTDALLLKSQAYYERSITRAARELYRSGDVETFLSAMDDIIQREIPRAMYAGMRECGLVPDDMTEEEQNELIDIMIKTSSFAPGLASGVTKLRDAGQRFDVILPRIATWSNQWSTAYNMGVMLCKDIKLEWLLGDTEHCKSCLKLAGYVKRASQWKKAGVGPQAGPDNELPNPKLECGGWQCDCRFMETDKQVRKGRLPRLP